MKKNDERKSIKKPLKTKLKNTSFIVSAAKYLMFIICCQMLPIILQKKIHKDININSKWIFHEFGKITFLFLSKKIIKHILIL